jgi:hypothetical protein
MKLYLGNSQDVVIDAEEIQVHPIACSRGCASNAKARCAWQSCCWNGIQTHVKYFYYKTSKMRATCYTEKEAEKLAREHNAENSSNTNMTSITVKVADINKMIMTRFRYVQPKIDYPARKVPIDPRFIGLWLGDGTASNTSITNVDPAVIDYIHAHAASLDMAVTKRTNDICYFTIKANLMRGGTNLSRIG